MLGRLSEASALNPLLPGLVSPLPSTVSPQETLLPSSLQLLAFPFPLRGWGSLQRARAGVAGCVPQPFGTGCCWRWSHFPPFAGGTGGHQPGDWFLPWRCRLSEPLFQLSSLSLGNCRGSRCRAWGHCCDCVPPATAQGVAVEYRLLLIASLSCSSRSGTCPALPAYLRPVGGCGDRIVAFHDAMSWWGCSDTLAPSPKTKHSVGSQFLVPGTHTRQLQGKAAVSNHYSWGWERGLGFAVPQNPWGGRGRAKGVSALQGPAGLVPPAAHPPPGPAPHLHLRALPHPPLPRPAHQIRLPELP